ncbi:MAG: ABC transporter substrate-binding protein, partial [Acidimicrobiales bacterium]
MRVGSSRRVMALLVVVAALVPWMVPGPAGGQAAESPGRVVRIPFPRDDGTLTPYTFQLGYPLVNLVYDTLLWRDTEGVPRPWLAQALETSPDATRFTLRLTPDVRWHDGAPLTAEDVRFTFGYVASRPHPRFTAGVAEVAEVTTPDPATVVITTRRPAPGLVDQTLADLPIMPAHLWQNLPTGQTEPAGLAVGSGPYRLVERLDGGGYRFEANAAYFKGAPTVGQIVVPIISDLDATLDAFGNRTIDMIPLRLPPDEVRNVDRLVAKVARGPSYWGVQLVFNLRRAPFDDPEARRAVALAIDLGRLAQNVSDAVPADEGMLHPESAWAPGRSLKA